MAIEFLPDFPKRLGEPFLNPFFIFSGKVQGGKHLILIQISGCLGSDAPHLVHRKVFQIQVDLPCRDDRKASRLLPFRADLGNNLIRS